MFFVNWDRGYARKMSGLQVSEDTDNHAETDDHTPKIRVCQIAKLARIAKLAEYLAISANFAICLTQPKTKMAWDFEVYYEVIGRLRLKHRSRPARNADFSALFLACFFLIMFMHLSLKTIQTGQFL